MENVLFLEDNVYVRNQLVEYAKSINDEITIFSVGSIADAKSLLRLHEFQAFFLDISLNDGSGIDFAFEIRNIVKYEFTPIVFITGDPLYELNAFHELHCFDYILKPYSLDCLSSLFRKILINYFSENKKMKLTHVILEFPNRKTVINFSDIEFVEYVNRKIVIRTIKEEIIYKRIPLSYFIKVFPSNFIQIHQSYFVNQKHVVSLDRANSSVVMKSNNMRLPIGRSFIKIVNQLFETEH